ncbi:unnamed protein product [Mytilus coruscus]|uniref:Peptidase A2 domain-containing protein n=1 Tax=Mytilus coruscus TaxID=42192 RepID=A0A6J8C182_MYTCO|nr:unnamed protein product [Mytilus coruscus]
MEQNLQELQNDIRELKNDSNSRQTEEPRTQNNNGRGRFNRGGFRQRGGRYNNNGRGFSGNTNWQRDNSYNGQSNYNFLNNSRGRGTTRMIKSSQNQKNGLHGNIGVSTAAHEAGMYVGTDLYGLSACLLVDTGVTVTIISEKTYNRIPRARQPDLMSSNQQVFTASGDQLNIVGKIDLEENSFEIDGTQAVLKYEGMFGCFRVIAKEKVVVPAKSEMIITGAVSIPKKESILDSDLMVKASDKFLQSGKGLVGRSLAKSGGEVLVRLMNTSTDSQIIYPGTAIAQVSPVQEVKLNEQNEFDKTYLRSDLKNLLSRSQKHLNSKEDAVVENLLKEYETLFSASDSDLGKTNVVKHKINTGTASPIKQAPRRLPNTLAKEVDDQVDGMLKNGLITPSMSPCPQEDEKVIELVRTIASSEEPSDTSFVEKQKQDDDLKMVRDWVELKKKPDFRKIGAESMTVKTLWALFESLVIHNDILCRQKKEPKTVLQAVVPKIERRNVLTQYHDNRTSAHLGNVNDIGDNIDSIVEVSNKETMSSKLSKPEESEFSNPVPSSVSGRLRRKPQWMNDYVK